MNKYRLLKKNFLNSRKLEKGQTTLLVVLMVMAISLGVGLAVSQRSTSNLRRTTFTSQTDQAFSCANSAAEDALLCIRDAEEDGDDPLSCEVTSSNPVSLCRDGSSTCTESNPKVCDYTYTVSRLDNEPEIELKKLEKDSVQQFDVTGTDNIDITWSNFNVDSDHGVGIELTHAYYDGSNYQMQKWAYRCGSVPDGVNVNGFTNSTESGGICNESITLDSAAQADQSYLRVRPYFNDAVVTVGGLEDNGTVSQGYKVVTQGIAGTIRRNIEVLRMNPQLPAIFDYVLYSEEGSIVK